MSSASIDGIQSPDIRKGTEATMAVQASLGEAVFLLARDAKWRHMSLMDIGWLLMPAIAANQFMTLRGKVKDKEGGETGVTIPLGLALWAKVSEEVSEKLIAQKKAEAPVRLSPLDWTSGEIPWLVLTSGPKTVRDSLIDKARDTLGSSLMEYEK